MPLAAFDEILLLIVESKACALIEVVAALLFRGAGNNKPVVVVGNG